MSRIAYVNGRYLPHAAAVVHIEDRGYQFSDGVYEVIAVAAGALVDEAAHLDRLARSLAELRIDWPLPRAALRLVMRQVARRNLVRDGIVYLQITRGVAARDHAFPRASSPALVVTARRRKTANPRAANHGVRVITIPDIRWGRCDIKTVSLLPNVLGKQRAIEAGAYEAWQVASDGMVTEGTSTNAWIVTGERALVTREASNAILDGITRRSVLALAHDQGLLLVERPFSVEEAKAAPEAFLTSTTSFVLPVVEIDGVAVGDGRPGPLSRALRAHYLRHMTA